MSNTTIPPVNTNPTIPISGAEFDSGGVAVLIIISVIVLYLAYDWYKNSRHVPGADVRYRLEDMMSSDFNMNKLMFMQMGLAIPVIFCMISGMAQLLTDPAVGAMLIVVPAIGVFAPYYWMKDRSREQKRNRSLLDGYLWLKDGRRIAYSFSNVKFGTEVMLSDTDEKTLYDANPQWEINDMIEAIVDSDDDKYKFLKEKPGWELSETLTDEEQKLFHEETPDWIMGSMLKDIHVIPMTIDEQYLVYLISKHPESEIFEWVEGVDLDYFGYYTIDTDGPELREVAELVHVRPDEQEGGVVVDEYVPALLVLWDAKRSKESVKSIAPVDITSDDVLAGLTKQIGAEKRSTASSYNTVSQALVLKNADSESLALMSEAIGRDKAIAYEKNKSLLTKQGGGGSDLLWKLIGLVCGGAFLLWLGYQMGYAGAIIEVARGVLG